MELSNSFEVDRPIDEAWDVLTDLELIAPCLPGAHLDEINGEEHLGTVKVKVGPITAQYKGAAAFVERDAVNHRAVLKADGRDTRGAGNATALITAQLEAVSATSTKIDVNSDITITGKVAQFGRGVMADVSAKLMGQFADNLGTMLESASSAGEGADADTSPEPADERVDSTDAAGSDGVEAVDLLDLAGAPVLKRARPVLVAIVVIVIVLILRSWVMRRAVTRASRDDHHA